MRRGIGGRHGRERRKEWVVRQQPPKPLQSTKGPSARANGVKLQMIPFDISPDHLRSLILNK